jgi:DDE superfamily endonuclease
MALNVEEHTITQSVLALEQPGAWKALESFAEYGAWHADRVTRALTRLIETAPGRIWHGYHVWPVDDTKVHRCSPHVWGTCTFHEYTARCPNRASTVRAHNWVVCGAVLQEPSKPGWFLPIAGRLYFRKSQLPAGPEGIEPFQTKCELAVDLLRAQARIVPGKHLGVFDGGSAPESVVRPLVLPEDGSPRVEILTRLRHDARLYARPPKGRPKGKRGPMPDWGKKLPPPRQGGRWAGPWHVGFAFVYGRSRSIRWKEVICLWRVLDHEVPVKAIVASVEGYKKRFTLVTSAVELTGLQMVELFAARFRQEDGFRDLKQRLGWEECRAWTKEPIERTSQAQWVTMSLLRLLQFRLEATGEVDWWLRPPWNTDKDRPSVLDAQRLMRRHRAEIQRLLWEWVRDEGKTEGDAA